MILHYYCCCTYQ